MKPRPFNYFVEIPYKNVLIVRWAAGIGALLLVSFVLQSYGFKLYLLPWLPIGVIIHAGYGFMMSQKHTKVFSSVRKSLLHAFSISTKYYFINMC